VWRALLLSVPERGPWDWHVVADLLRICRTEQVAIWHGHDYKSNLLGLLLRRCWPMRLITTVHGWGVAPTRRTPLYYGIDRLCLRFYERVVCVSEDLREQCVAAGVPSERCLLIENAIDTEEFSRKRTRQQAKRQFGIPPGRFMIGAVGRLSKEKGFDLLIRATDQLLLKGFDVGLLIVGEGDQREALRALIGSLGRADRISLLGFRSDAQSLYELMDAFVLSSLSEGLPNAMLEALAMKVPTISTRIAGVPRVIQPEENGLLVAPGSWQELFVALAQLIEDPRLGDRLRESGRKTIEQRYSFRRRMEKIQTIYDNLLPEIGRMGV